MTIVLCITLDTKSTSGLKPILTHSKNVSDFVYWAWTAINISMYEMKRFEVWNVKCIKLNSFSITHTFNETLVLVIKCY